MRYNSVVEYYGSIRFLVGEGGRLSRVVRRATSCFVAVNSFAREYKKAFTQPDTIRLSNKTKDSELGPESFAAI